MLPIYKMSIDENDDETRVEYNSFVDVPAHMKAYATFKDAITYKFNEDKQIVTGVMISVGTPIYRFDREIGEHYVLFDKETVQTIAQKFMKEGRQNNVNLMHDMNKVQNGAIMIESYFLNSERGINAPNEFKSLNLMDGTWIASYKITDKSLWNEVKTKFRGFSVEGVFNKQLININKVKMKKERKSLFSLIASKFNNDEQVVEVSFTDATAIDGVVYSYEGNLEVGKPIFITDENGTKIPATEGAIELTLEDGSKMAVTIDVNGLIAEVSTVEKEATDVEEGMRAEIMAEVAEVMSATIQTLNEKFEAVSNELKAIKEAKASKFEADHKAGAKEENRMTIKDLMKNKK